MAAGSELDPESAAFCQTPLPAGRNEPFLLQDAAYLGQLNLVDMGIADSWADHEAGISRA